MNEFLITTSILKECSVVDIVDNNEYFSGSSTRYLGYASFNPPYHIPNISGTNKNKNYREGIHVGKVNIFNSNTETSTIMLFPYFIGTSQSIKTYNHLDINIELSKEAFDKIKSEEIYNDKSVHVKFSCSNTEIQNNNLINTPIECKLLSIKIINYVSHQEFIKNKINELEYFLVDKHCITSDGTQASIICQQFAKSLSEFDTQEETDIHIEKLDEFLNNLRSTLVHAQGEKISLIKRELNIEHKGYLSHEDIQVVKDRIRGDREAERQFDLLWRKDSSSKIFSDGQPYDENEIKNLAVEYVQLGIRSKCCESILIQLLTSLPIATVAGPAQNLGEISKEALLMLPYPIYDKKKIDGKKPIKELLFKMFGMGILVIIGIPISGYFNWWLTGLVANSNQTAHLILFGIMFLASWYSTSYSMQKTNSKNDEIEKKHYENLVLMCNLYEQSDFVDIGLIRAMLYSIEIRGIKYPGELYAILSIIEK